ncbi:uncharacterized protein LOC123708584 [Pieris brassicae]|uniref:Tetraspanin n=1 Tax=Pieris brassicae TaxID=7116 RepID=A0A9P0SL97_PIEBR|nr:uncharacterized protein LOC123708584 [Pieris brassicae]CAH3887804.1 unnamed protein product [Pieris brassicae]
MFIQRSSGAYDYCISAINAGCVDVCYISGNREMGNTKSAQENEPQANDEKSKPAHSQGFGQLYAAEIEHFRKKPCCRTFLKVLFVILATLTIIQSIVVIAVSIASAIASKVFNQDQSSRLVALILIAVTAAVTISVVIYTLIAVLKKKKKPVHATTATMVILAILQAVILGVCMRVTVEDEILLNRSLIDSFRLAKDDNPRHMKIWATTQKDLSCCGVYSAEDYRRSNISPYFPPDVPISCCPSYDPRRSDLLQEKERESCKAKREFYENGCKTPVLVMFKFTCALVIMNTIVLIVLELLVAFSGVLHLKIKHNVKADNMEQIAVAPIPMPRASLSSGKTKSVSST